MMENYNLNQALKYVLEWYEHIHSLIDEPNYIEITKNQKDVLIVDMTFKNCIAQIVVSDPGFAPYKYVFFEALSLKSKKTMETNQPDLIYFFYDSYDMTMNEVIDELNIGIQYCMNYIPEGLENMYINKKGTLNFENKKLNRVIYFDDIKIVNKELLSGEFTCIGTQFQYIVVKNDYLQIRILPQIFNLK